MKCKINHIAVQKQLSWEEAFTKPLLNLNSLALSHLQLGGLLILLSVNTPLIALQKYQESLNMNYVSKRIWSQVWNFVRIIPQVHV